MSPDVDSDGRPTSPAPIEHQRLSVRFSAKEIDLVSEAADSKNISSLSSGSPCASQLLSHARRVSSRSTSLSSELVRVQSEEISTFARISRKTSSRLSAGQTRRLVSDSSGRLVDVDDAAIVKLLGITAAEFEEELTEQFQAGLDERIDEDTVEAVVDICGAGDGSLDLSEYIKLNYDILSVQCELHEQKHAVPSFSRNESSRVFPAGRTLLSNRCLTADPRVDRIFWAWTEEGEDCVNISALFRGLNRIPEVNWSGGAVRAGIRAIMKFDNEAENSLTRDEFPSVLGDLCAEELDATFEAIADQLVAAAEGREDLEVIREVDEALMTSSSCYV